jgi:hypothetical protein
MNTRKCSFPLDIHHVTHCAMDLPCRHMLYFNMAVLNTRKCSFPLDIHHVTHCAMDVPCRHMLYFDMAVLNTRKCSFPLDIHHVTHCAMDVPCRHMLYFDMAILNTRKCSCRYTIFCQIATLEPWVLLHVWCAAAEALAHRKQNSCNCSQRENCPPGMLHCILS